MIKCTEKCNGCLFHGSEEECNFTECSYEPEYDVPTFDDYGSIFME
jgi:hypothetical protein